VLNMAVVGFGEKSKICCGATRDYKIVQKAIEQVGAENGSGTENVMGAISFAASGFGGASKKKIFIVVTDEGGDDDGKLEDVLRELKNNKVSLMVMGGEASFGSSIGSEEVAISYEGRTQTFAPAINSGMETPASEILNFSLPLKELHPTDDNQGIFKSGFGPYALVRLCAQTDGKYFFLKTPAHNPDKMKLYAPDLCSIEEYNTKNTKDPLRASRAETIAGLKKYRELKTRGRGCGKFSNKADFKNDIDTAVENIKLFDELAKKIELLLKNSAPNAANKRWVANNELIYAQLLFGRFWLSEYKTTLEEFLRKPGLFKPPYHIAPKDGVNPIDAEKYIPVVQAALQKIIINHPDTPWSDIAKKLQGEFNMTYVLEAPGPDSKPSKGVDIKKR